MTTKQFRVPREDRPPLDFELVYDRFINDEWVEQTDKFQMRPTVPGNLMLAMTAAANASEAIQASELVRMLHRAIIKDDEERFFELLDDSDTAVPIETLADIIVWLAGEYGGRPTRSAKS
jgi:hypothetical protein